jgi:hypothetical protein
LSWAHWPWSARTSITRLSASLDQQFELDFESRKATNPLLNVGKARPGDAVGRRAWLIGNVL